MMFSIVVVVVSIAVVAAFFVKHFEAFCVYCFNHLSTNEFKFSFSFCTLDLNLILMVLLVLFLLWETFEYVVHCIRGFPPFLQA